MRKSFYSTYALPILMAFFFAVPFLMQGADRAVRSNTNKVTDWLPETFQEMVEFRWFRDHFVGDQFVLISWPDCTLGDEPSQADAKADDPRIERLANYLVPPKGKKRGEHTKYFQSVTTARRTLNELTSKPSEVPYKIAVERLKGTLIGPDDRQTCVVVMLSNAAIDKFRTVIGRSVPAGVLPWQREPGVLIEALTKCGIDPEVTRLGGPPVENVAIDEEGDRTLLRLSGIAGVLGLVLAWWSLRSVRLTLIVFACGILSAAAGLAAISWSGGNTDAIIMAMPSMLYVLAISGAVHLVNYYRDALHEHGPEEAPSRALAHGWKPALLCNITTGVGLASLATADLAPIRNFGIYSAIGVALMLIFLFFFLPAALHVWPLRADKKPHIDDPGDHSGSANCTGAGTIWSQDYWARFGERIVRHHGVVAAACFIFIIIASLGLTRVETNIDLLKLFDENVRVRHDYVWLEEKIGRLVPLEVVVKFPQSKVRSATEDVDAAHAASTLSYLERLELVSLIQQMIDQELGPSGRDLVGPSLSPVTFAPPILDGNRDQWSLARRSVTNKKLEESESALKRSGYLEDEESTGTELWRISLRAASFADLDYGVFVNSVREVIEPVLAAQRTHEQALEQIVAKRGAIAGGSVCLWKRGEENDAELKNSALDAPAYQARIHALATQLLLDKARLRLTAANVEMSGLDEAQRNAALEQFKKFDCVVALGGVSEAEIQSMHEAGVPVIDARGDLAHHSDEPQMARKATTAVYTGVVPIVYKAQRALLDSLIQSSFWSFIIITPLIMLVCRSIAGGTVVMLPNVLPVLVIFGGMGWLGVPIDIGSMMAASIALGVAVDDTIHYLTWYREGLNTLRDRHKAIDYAYRRCAAPTLQAALISGLGLSVFTLSTFTPTQRMGWLMMTILIAGVVAELIMMPAILAGPLGKVFKVPPLPPSAPVPAPHAVKRKSRLVSSQT